MPNGAFFNPGAEGPGAGHGPGGDPAAGGVVNVGPGGWGTPATGAPGNGKGGTGDEGGNTGDTTVKTLADLISQGLSATSGGTPQTIIQPTDMSGGGGLNLTTVLVVAGVGFAAWMLWKKFGKGGA